MKHRKPLSSKEQRHLNALAEQVKRLKYCLREEWARRLFKVCWKTIERAVLGNPLNAGVVYNVQRGLLIDSK
jgi:hypothetical protein